MNHLNQEPLDFAAAVALLGKARKELHEAIDELADKAERLRKQVRYSEALNEELRQAIALLRELNDALVIPGWLQPRVDAVLDGHEAVAKVAWKSVTETPDLDGHLWPIVIRTQIATKLAYEYYHFDNGWATDEEIMAWLPVSIPSVDNLPLPQKEKL